MARFREKLRHAWNAFTNNSDIDRKFFYGESTAQYGSRPDRTRLRFTSERSLISSIYNRVGIDAASLELRHVRLDANDRYKEDIVSGLSSCLKIEANIDQGARAFRQDMVMTLLDKGVIAVVPIDTTVDPSVSGSFDIQTLRIGEVVAWFPKHVRVSVYNEKFGRKEEITLEKS
jgi:hypothetical protein